ncbi:MAG: hypothetical protein F6K19_35475 [Cyanothece sp. SIO1E1]|nr:hypothetical protein [Cyanothece sp. SIO1E1]
MVLDYGIPGRGTQAPLADLPQSYAAATPEQQMALSLLAAQEIMGALTLAVSPSQPKLEREWITAAGPLVLGVEYQSDSPTQLKVQGRLPCGGCLKLAAGDAQTQAQRTSPGELNVTLSDLQPGQVYSLAVLLSETEQHSLMFAIHTVSDE